MKPADLGQRVESRVVTSHAEVWIETCCPDGCMRTCGSPPTRRCGLKRDKGDITTYNMESPPTRRCGLKHIYRGREQPSVAVTSHAEVWIETRTKTTQTEWRECVTSHAEVWIETQSAGLVTEKVTVTSHAEVWIETILAKKRRRKMKVTSHAEVWIETYYFVLIIVLRRSHLPRGGVD